MDGKTELPVGSKITIEKYPGGGWRWEIKVAGGGFIGQPGPRPTLSEVFEQVKSITTET